MGWTAKEPGAWRMSTGQHVCNAAQRALLRGGTGDLQSRTEAYLRVSKADKEHE